MIIGVLTCVIRNYSVSDWSDLTGRFRDTNLLQSWAYGEAKARTGSWRVERGIFEEDNQIKGVFQALVRDLPVLGGGLVWMNRGPLWHPIEGEPKAEFGELAEALGNQYVENQSFYVRLAPPVNVDALIDGQPLERDFVLAGEPGWASAALDLSPATEDLRQGLKQKWRNGLNKAERSEFEVKEGTDDALFKTFLDAHTEFISAKGFDTSVTPGFLQSLNDFLPNEKKLYTLVAYLNGNPAGSALIARYGNSGEYLAGNTTDEGRRLNVGQLLLWRAVEALKQQGLKRFDLGGMDEILTPKGIYRFKEGLGGVPYRLAPELELGGGSLRGRLVRWRVNRARAAGS